MFFAFSTFVMQALARLPPPQGIAAMQSINVKRGHPGVHDGAVRHGRGVRGAGRRLAVRWDEPFAAYLLVGGVLYLVARSF